jgi:hypothetical protein
VPLGSAYVSDGVQFMLTEIERLKYKYEASDGSTGTVLCPTPEFAFFILQPQAPTQLSLATPPKTILGSAVGQSQPPQPTTILAQTDDGSLVGFKCTFKGSATNPVPVTFAVLGT